MSDRKEGWSDSIISRSKTHYYVDGVSLCGRKGVDRGNRNFEIRTGSKFFNDCELCIKKLKERDNE